MQLKNYLLRLKSDPFIWAIILATGALISYGMYVLWQDYVSEQRARLVDQLYGKDLRGISVAISENLASKSLQLKTLADQQEAPSHLQNGNNDALDASEIDAISVMETADAIYYFDQDLLRHSADLSPAAMMFARQRRNNATGKLRAVRIEGDWKLLMSVTLHVGVEQVGQIFLLQPLDSLGDLMAGGDSEQGTLHLEQNESGAGTTKLLSIGQGGQLGARQDGGGLNTTYPIQDTSWQLTFEPSQSLKSSINEAEQPILIGIVGIVFLWLLGIHFTIKMRMNRGSSEISIFTNQSQDVRTIRLPAQKEDEVQIEEEIISEEPVTDTPNLASATDSSSTSQTNDLGEEFESLNDSTVSDESNENSDASDDYNVRLHDLDPAQNEFVVPELVFRDYDIRGIAHEEITEEFARRLGKTVGSLVLRRGNNAIYLGRDGRASSPELALALRDGLLSTGCNVIDLGQIITPALNFAIHYSGQSSCGIMVTASHNPSHFNGFKIIVQGQVLSGNMLQLLKPIMVVENYTEGHGEYFSRLVIPQYVRQIFEDVGIVREFKVVVDGANSISGPVAVELFESLGCEVVPLYCEIDGSFPNHEPNPSDEFNLLDLRARVASENADLGFAFDGDGDRLVVISSKGRICWPDRLMMLFAQDILQSSPGQSIVYDVKSSQKLVDIIKANKGEPVMCKTGHAHVRKAVQEVNAPLGGEFSGHIFFTDRREGFDDGLYAAARLLEILTATYKNLDQLLDELDPSVYTGEILIPVPDDEKFALMQRISEECEFKGARITRLDGLRVEYPQGWGLVRASNTSANLTLRFEAEDHNILGYIRQTFKYKLAALIPNIEDFL